MTVITARHNCWECTYRCQHHVEHRKAVETHHRAWDARGLRGGLLSDVSLWPWVGLGRVPEEDVL